ncbi:DUF3833 family protein [Sphingomonas glacialis]|uniref:DUF3833 family protein n=1 Tax=Sphingomonas glacialis TaxID=658225 RepID=A0A502G3W1_9SPHN|nr:DUF3833 family protein [Sphingomonas glacialis]TPG56251.1 DUF3833 family protein [Sphingomonas glacialis]
MTSSDRATRPGIAPLCALIAGLGLAGCVSTTHLASAPAPRFDAVAFFAGRSEGKGVLKIALHRPATTLVEGNGRVTDDGSIVLDQTVRRQGKPATRRQWVLHPVGTDRYTGTLSDAVGPVDGRVDGTVLHLRFAMKGGLQAEQFLDLQPGGTVAQNVMIVRKMGVAVARLDETITRLGR